MAKKVKKQSKISSQRNEIFFAYQSSEKTGNSDNVDAIKHFAKNAPQRVIIWEDLRTNGKLINKTVLSAIEKCSLFACDLTYQNPNVFFELGYAIGRNKPLFILLNTYVNGATEKYKQIEILKGISYSHFSNDKDILHAYNSELNILESKLDNSTVLSEKNSIDILYIKNRTNTQAELDVRTYILQSAYTNICDDPTEISYQPYDWYLSALNRCKSVIVHLSSKDRSYADLTNVKNSLYAGIGLAMGKEVVLVAPKPYSAPIDYHDILIEYENADQCVDLVSAWLSRIIKKLPIVREKKSDDEIELNLLKLGLGYSIAEDEKKELNSYFVETYAYRQAKKDRLSVFYGRKGTGKTALFYQLSQNFSEMNKTLVISLKPESTELLETLQAAEWLNVEARRSSVFGVAWKYILCTRLLSAIRDEQEKTITFNTELNDLYNNITYFYDNTKDKTFDGFMSVLTVIDRIFNSKIEQAEKDVRGQGDMVDEINSLSIFYNEYTNPIITILTQYFRLKQDTQVVILADNLDKAWDAKNNLSVQADMILSLFEEAGRFLRPVVEKVKGLIDPRCIIFLRKDIYLYVLNKSREPDKLTINSHEIEWGTYPELLKEVVERRIRYVLDLDNETTLDSVWMQYFASGKKVINEVLEVCLSRPRDIVWFFAKMFESACNNHHKMVDETDFSNAQRYYCNFLASNLVAELSAKYVYIRELISEIYMKYPTRFVQNDFDNLAQKYNKQVNTHELLEDLFNNEYLVGVTEDFGVMILTYDDFLKTQEKYRRTNKFRLANRKEVYLILHPKYRTNIRLLPELKVHPDRA